MPILTVRLSQPADATKHNPLGAQVAATLSQLTQTVLGKKPEVTSIALQWVDPSHWYVAGRSLAAQGRSSFFLEIRITDETNTKDEKARYIAAVFKAMAGLLEHPLHPESYIHVHDVRAAAYGYGGLTQEARYQHPA